MLSPEQLALRRTGIPSTDIGPVLGVSRWRFPIDVWRDKTGRAPAERPTSDAASFGTHTEPWFVQWYCRRQGVEAAFPGTLRHPDDPLLLATPDAVVDVPGRGPVLVEVKTTGPRLAADWGEPGSDQVPAYYLTQVTQAMAVTGIRQADVVAYMGDVGRIGVYTVDYDPALFAMMRDRAHEFWDTYVVPDVPPPVDSSAGWDRWLRDQWPGRTRGEYLPVDEETQGLVDQLAETDCLLREANAVRSDVVARLKQAIADRDGIMGDGWRIDWKRNRDSLVTDWRAVAEAAGATRELIEQHTAGRPGARPFTPRNLHGKE